MNQKVWHKNYDPGLPYHLDLPEIPVNRLLEDRAAAMPDGTACTILGRTYTYRRINQKANLLAHALLNWGLSIGDRVAVIMGNSPSFISCQYGILKAGGTVVPVNPLYTGREMSHILSDCAARLAVVHSRFAGQVAAIMNKTGLEKLIVAP
ncbi:MAG: AMP-binding protein, partial [Pseudomonadota bacterium]